MKMYFSLLLQVAFVSTVFNAQSTILALSAVETNLHY